MQPNPSITGGNDMSYQARDYRPQTNLQGTGSQVGASPQSTQHARGKIIDPISFSVNDNRGESGGSTYMLNTKASGSGHANQPFPNPLQAPQPGHYFQQGSGVWPPWRATSVLSPFGDMSPIMGGAV
ncbi:hypothetical protein M758_UG195800 [Ceratodon purpureus]|nr:hypothetical protein M758_UG195800 [Ceratodon purpureus]